MTEPLLLGDVLRARGISRRALLKLCRLHRLAAGAAAVGGGRDGRRPGPGATAVGDLAVVPGVHRLHRVADALVQPKPRGDDLELISLDYHHTLQAVSGVAAEDARRQAMRDNQGKYVVVVDGSVPMGGGGVYSAIAGQSNVAMLAETVEHAAAVIAIGTCVALAACPRPTPTRPARSPSRSS